MTATKVADKRMTMPEIKMKAKSVGRGKYAMFWMVQRTMPQHRLLLYEGLP